MHESGNVDKKREFIVPNPKLEHNMHIPSSMHEFNFIPTMDTNKLLGNMVPDFLAGDLYSHLNYHHLPNVVVSAEKMKSGAIGVVDVESLLISKQGSSKGAKTKKETH